MNDKFIRVYQKHDLQLIQKHLMIYGDLSGQCAHCQALDIKWGDLKCPQCQTDFFYISFRNIRNHLPKMQRLSEENPAILFVDHDDFKRMTAEAKAKDFLK